MWFHKEKENPLSYTNICLFSAKNFNIRLLSHFDMSFIILFFHLSFVYVALHFCLISYNVYMESMKLYKFCNCLKRTNKYFLSSHSNFFSSLFSWCMDLLDTSHFCPFNLSILISNLHSHFFSICVSLLSYLIWNSLIARAYCIRWGRQQKKKIVPE